MSRTDSRAHLPKPGQPFTPYQFARTCAMAWLKMNGMEMPDQTSASKIAKRLGLTFNKSRPGYAKKALVEWHLTALEGNKQEPVAVDDFYSSQAWRTARYQALKNCNGRCTLCGQPPGRYSLHVDHIKPRSLYPVLALDPANLQVLCRDCNLGKSNKDSVDWRTARAAPADVEGEYSDYAIGKMLRQIA